MSELFRVSVCRYTYGKEPWCGYDDTLLWNGIVRAETADQVRRIIGIEPGQLDVHVSPLEPMDIAKLADEMEELRDRYL